MSGTTRDREYDRRLIESALRRAREIPTPAVPVEPLPDSFVGYEVIREIHRGAQGVVYQAIQRSTKRKVAVKVMREGPFASSRDKARFDREVQILGQLKHPNIVDIHDSGEAAGHCYFVMDYIPGEPLDLWMASAERSIEDTLRVFAKICDAVNTAHLRGVIHRDLKPGNIRIDNEGEPHVLDFGLAKMAMSHTTGDSSPQLMTFTGQFIGSLPWASPEQASGSSNQIDTRTDVYSLGVILYQMLTGHFPYEVVGSMRDVLNNILQAEPQKPSTIRRRINHEVETILLKCLSKERERRYQNAGELSRDVRHYLAGEPIEAKRASTAYVVSKSLRRHKGLALAVTAMVIVACTAGFYWWQQAVLSEAGQLVAEGRRLEDLGRRSEASARYDQALALVPNHHEALANKAFALKEEYFDQKFGFRERWLLEESNRLCDRALGLDPNRASLWNLRCVLLYSMDRLPEAEEAAQRALHLDPDFYWAASNLAKVLAVQHRFEEALQAIKKGIETAAPKEETGEYAPGIWRTLGTLQLFLGQAEAVQSLEEAVEKDRSNPESRLILARAHLLLPDYKDCHVALEEAKHGSANSRHPDPRLSRVLAQAHLCNEQFDDASRLAQAAAKQGDLSAYSSLISAIAEAHLEHPDMAREQLRQAINNWPADFGDDGVIVTVEKGMLWIDTLAELQELRAEAERLLAEDVPVSHQDS